MDRRTYLTGIGVTVAAAAGCSGGGGDDESGPKAAVRTYIEALDSTDAEQYNDIIHPDGPLTEVGSAQLEQLESVDYTIESLEVTEESEDSATVRAEYSVEGPAGSETVASDVELRTVDGEWKVYNDVLTQGSS
jgi:hypothetical protein